ncbi:MAG: hypothetical protein A4E31_00073 [Methanomassiliicoccales archaeon PtaU1.Bin030]|nr:MAG: hypothetical protein A4E31_00073 [Methanomassiliicoccales archaeon PtaU1.Bin030]
MGAPRPLVPLRAHALPSPARNAHPQAELRAPAAGELPQEPEEVLRVRAANLHGVPHLLRWTAHIPQALRGNEQHRGLHRIPRLLHGVRPHLHEGGPVGHQVRGQEGSVLGSDGADFAVPVLLPRDPDRPAHGRLRGRLLRPARHGRFRLGADLRFQQLHRLQLLQAQLPCGVQRHVQRHAGIGHGGGGAYGRLHRPIPRLHGGVPGRVMYPGGEPGGAQPHRCRQRVLGRACSQGA